MSRYLTVDEAEARQRATDERHTALTTELQQAEAEVERRTRELAEARSRRDRAEDACRAQGYNPAHVPPTPRPLADEVRQGMEAHIDRLLFGPNAAPTPTEDERLYPVEQTVADAKAAYRDASEALGTAERRARLLREQLSGATTERSYAAEDAAAARARNEAGGVPREHLEAHMDALLARAAGGTRR